MKPVLLIVFLLMLQSCSESWTGTGVEAEIPAVYKLFDPEHHTFHMDTLYDSGKKYSGYMYSFYPSGTDTFELISYCDGLQSGVSKKWYPGNRLMEVRSFCAGKKNGKQVSYWQNGNKRFEFTAKNDAYEGTLEEWDVNGHLYHLAHYVNGQEEGIQKLWYDNGKIRANYVIKNGKRYGLLGTKNCTNVSDSIFAVK
jgi:antitoxin component YwqK of YwqJK toxin-antitoxin module